MTVALSCGHGLQLRDGPDTLPASLPDHGPWIFYPVMDEHPVEVGDLMTCIVCFSTRTIEGISPDLIPMNDMGFLKI
jgi:hypothetical protein